jgi:FMN-dependent NADH-azoreductase
MSDLLVIQSSPRGEESESRKLAAAFLDAYGEADIDVLDLWSESLPVFGGDHVAAKMAVIGGVEHEGRVRTAWDEIVAVTERFTAAAQYLFVVPQWNHGVPWVLKQYIDTITQPGLTFGFDGELGYIGLVAGKRAAVLHTSAIWPTFGDNPAPDYVEKWLALIGITDVQSVRLGANLLDPNVADARARALTDAAALGRVFARARQPELQDLPAVR